MGLREALAQVLGVTDLARSTPGDSKSSPPGGGESIEQSSAAAKLQQEDDLLSKIMGVIEDAMPEESSQPPSPASLRLRSTPLLSPARKGVQGGKSEAASPTAARIAGMSISAESVQRLTAALQPVPYTPSPTRPSKGGKGGSSLGGTPSVSWAGSTKSPTDDSRLVALREHLEHDMAPEQAKALVLHEWVEAYGRETDKSAFESAALSSELTLRKVTAFTAPLGVPNDLSVATAFRVLSTLAQPGGPMQRFKVVLDEVQKILLRAVYLDAPSSDADAVKLIAGETAPAAVVKSGSGTPHAQDRGAPPESFLALYRLRSFFAAHNGLKGDKHALRGMVERLRDTLVQWERSRQEELRALGRAFNVVTRWRLALTQVRQARHVAQLRAEIASRDHMLMVAMTLLQPRMENVLSLWYAMASPVGPSPSTMPKSEADGEVGAPWTWDAAEGGGETGDAFQGALTPNQLRRMRALLAWAGQHSPWRNHLWAHVSAPSAAYLGPRGLAGRLRMPASTAPPFAHMQGVAPVSAVERLEMVQQAAGEGVVERGGNAPWALLGYLLQEWDVDLAAVMESQTAEIEAEAMGASGTTALHSVRAGDTKPGFGRASSSGGGKLLSEGGVHEAVATLAAEKSAAAEAARQSRVDEKLQELVALRRAVWSVHRTPSELMANPSDGKGGEGTSDAGGLSVATGAGEGAADVEAAAERRDPSFVPAGSSGWGARWAPVESPSLPQLRLVTALRAVLPPVVNQALVRELLLQPAMTSVQFAVAVLTEAMTQRSDMSTSHVASVLHQVVAARHAARKSELMSTAVEASTSGNVPQGGLFNTRARRKQRRGGVGGGGKSPAGGSTGMRAASPPPSEAMQRATAALTSDDKQLLGAVVKAVGDPTLALPLVYPLLGQAQRAALLRLALTLDADLRNMKSMQEHVVGIGSVEQANTARARLTLLPKMDGFLSAAPGAKKPSDVVPSVFRLALMHQKSHPAGDNSETLASVQALQAGVLGGAGGGFQETSLGGSTDENKTLSLPPSLYGSGDGAMDGASIDFEDLALQIDDALRGTAAFLPMAVMQPPLGGLAAMVKELGGVAMSGGVSPARGGGQGKSRASKKGRRRSVMSLKGVEGGASSPSLELPPDNTMLAAFKSESSDGLGAVPGWALPLQGVLQKAVGGGVLGSAAQLAIRHMFLAGSTLEKILAVSSAARFAWRGPLASAVAAAGGAGPAALVAARGVLAGGAAGGTYGTESSLAPMNPVLVIRENPPAAPEKAAGGGGAPSKQAREDISVPSSPTRRRVTGGAAERGMAQLSAGDRSEVISIQHMLRNLTAAEVTSVFASAAHELAARGASVLLRAPGEEAFTDTVHGAAASALAGAAAAGRSEASARSASEGGGVDNADAPSTRGPSPLFSSLQRILLVPGRQELQEEDEDEVGEEGLENTDSALHTLYMPTAPASQTAGGGGTSPVATPSAVGKDVSGVFQAGAGVLSSPGVDRSKAHAVPVHRVTLVRIAELESMHMRMGVSAVATGRTAAELAVLASAAARCNKALTTQLERAEARAEQLEEQLRALEAKNRTTSMASVSARGGVKPSARGGATGRASASGRHEVITISSKATSGRKTQRDQTKQPTGRASPVGGPQKSPPPSPGRGRGGFLTERTSRQANAHQQSDGQRYPSVDRSVSGKISVDMLPTMPEGESVSGMVAPPASASRAEAKVTSTQLQLTQGGEGGSKSSRKGATSRSTSASSRKPTPSRQAGEMRDLSSAGSNRSIAPAPPKRAPGPPKTPPPSALRADATAVRNGTAFEESGAHRDATGLDEPAGQQGTGAAASASAPRQGMQQKIAEMEAEVAQLRAELLAAKQSQSSSSKKPRRHHSTSSRNSHGVAPVGADDWAADSARGGGPTAHFAERHSLLSPPSQVAGGGSLNFNQLHESAQAEPTDALQRVLSQTARSGDNGLDASGRAKSSSAAAGAAGGGATSRSDYGATGGLPRVGSMSKKPQPSGATGPAPPAGFKRQDGAPADLLVPAATAGYGPIDNTSKRIGSRDAREMIRPLGATSPSSSQQAAQQMLLRSQTVTNARAGGPGQTGVSSDVGSDLHLGSLFPQTTRQAAYAGGQGRGGEDDASRVGLGSRLAVQLALPGSIATPYEEMKGQSTLPSAPVEAASPKNANRRRRLLTGGASTVDAGTRIMSDSESQSGSNVSGTSGLSPSTLATLHTPNDIEAADLKSQGVGATDTNLHSSAQASSLLMQIFTPSSPNEVGDLSPSLSQDGTVDVRVSTGALSAQRQQRTSAARSGTLSATDSVHLGMTETGTEQGSKTNSSSAFSSKSTTAGVADGGQAAPDGGCSSSSEGGAARQTQAVVSNGQPSSHTAALTTGPSGGAPPLHKAKVSAVLEQNSGGGAPKMRQGTDDLSSSLREDSMKGMLASDAAAAGLKSFGSVPNLKAPSHSASAAHLTASTEQLVRLPGSTRQATNGAPPIPSHSTADSTILEQNHSSSKLPGMGAGTGGQTGDHPPGAATTTRSPLTQSASSGGSSPVKGGYVMASVANVSAFALQGDDAHYPPSTPEARRRARELLQKDEKLLDAGRESNARHDSHNSGSVRGGTPLRKVRGGASPSQEGVRDRAGSQASEGSLGMSSVSMGLPAPLAPIQGGGIGAAIKGPSPTAAPSRPPATLAPVQQRPALSAPPPSRHVGGSFGGVRSPSPAHRGASPVVYGLSAERGFSGTMDGAAVGGGAQVDGGARDLHALRMSSGSREGARPTISKSGKLQGGESILVGVSGGGVAAGRSRSPGAQDKIRRRAPLYVDDGAAASSAAADLGTSGGLGFTSFSSSLSLGGRGGIMGGPNASRGRLPPSAATASAAAGAAPQLSVSTFGARPNPGVHIGSLATPSRGRMSPGGGARSDTSMQGALQVSGAGGGAGSGQGGARSTAGRGARMPLVTAPRSTASIGGGQRGGPGPSLSLGGQSVRR